MSNNHSAEGYRKRIEELREKKETNSQENQCELRLSDVKDYGKLKTFELKAFQEKSMRGMWKILLNK